MTVKLLLPQALDAIITRDRDLYQISFATADEIAALACSIDAALRGDNQDESVLTQIVALSPRPALKRTRSRIGG